jgi:hypothetical protein
MWYDYDLKEWWFNCRHFGIEYISQWMLGIEMMSYLRRVAFYFGPICVYVDFPRNISSMMRDSENSFCVLIGN